MWSDDGRQHGAKSYPQGHQGSRSKRGIEGNALGTGAGYAKSHPRASPRTKRLSEQRACAVLYCTQSLVDSLHPCRCI